MKLPYGITDFKELRKENYFYIDKTQYIEILESLNSKYLFFIRPRRFGKSLFLSTLEYYYDLNKKDVFENLFSGLFIGNNPTKLKNEYFILSLDFSGLNTDSQKSLKESFRKTVLSGLIRFLKRYNYYIANVEKVIDKLEHENDLKRMLEIVFTLVEEVNKKIYVLIDEYDHFANDILAIGDGDFYKDTIRARGFVRDFYETLKIGAKSVIDRIFMTGISPIMLDDLTSGFNITDNLTMNPLLNEMLGFTEQELIEFIDKIEIDIKKENLLSELKLNYNGYLFSIRGKERVYNPDMILSFFNNWQQIGDYPEKLIDDNVKTDYGRLQRLIANRENKSILEEIILKEEIVSDIVSRFSFDRMYDQEYFISLLFYMGLLTIDKKHRSRLILKIPNYVIKTIYWEYLQKSLVEQYKINFDLDELRKSVEKLAYDGEIESYIEYVSKNILKQLSNRDLLRFDEKYIKIILFSNLASGEVYKICSEREVEGGYIDLFLEKDSRYPDIEYEWLWELKYLKKEAKFRIEQVKKEGLKQLEEYAASKKFVDKKNLKKALIIFIGKDEYEIIEV
ncbi:MAG: AAA family ATPase [Halanaerobiales bacterium]|nr:AAA family ATPase [Halanaerobiales bacterium]